MDWMHIDILEKEITGIDDMSDNKNTINTDCLVSIQNISNESINFIFLRKDVEGEKIFDRPGSKILQSGKISRYNEKALNWDQIRSLQLDKKIFVFYSSAAEDVIETDRFDLLDFE